jgi:hypothetical protein
VLSNPSADHTQDRVEITTDNPNPASVYTHLLPRPAIQRQQSETQRDDNVG